MVDTLLQKLEKAARTRQLDKNSKESLEWFRKNARKTIGREQAQTLLIKQQERAQQIGKRPPIGKMFTYAYDPKHKDTLPYYDRFPLGFYIGPAKGGFYLINLHYLSPKYRAVLFDALLNVTNDPRYTENTKLKITYSLLSGSQKFRYFKPCFKHYLVNHLETRVVEIPYDEWEAALFLPTAEFEGASASQVWSDSALGVNK